jgi:aspartate-semialdehyde dehydrogenase
MHAELYAQVTKGGKGSKGIFITEHWQRQHSQLTKKQKIEEPSVKDNKLSATSDDGNEQSNHNLPSHDKDANFIDNDSSFDYKNETAVIVDEVGKEIALDDNRATDGHKQSAHEGLRGADEANRVDVW